MTHKRVRTHSNPLGFHQKLSKLDFDNVFSNFKGKIDFEVGSGKGKFLQKYSERFPERNILGSEIRRPMVENYESENKTRSFKNSLMIYASSERCLEDIIPEQSIERCFIFHPDPWLKKRHHKRRVIREYFLNLLSPKLTIGAKLYVSTDVLSLWDDINECMEKHPDFKRIDDPEFWNETYSTHWTEFSIIDQRSINKGTWEFNR